MSSSKPPSYLRHKARGLAKTIVNGRTIYLGAYGSKESHLEYNRILENWRIRQADPSRPVDPGKPKTLNDLVSHYYHHAEVYYRNPDGSKKRELIALNYSLGPVLALHGKTLIRDFGPKALKECRELLVKGWTPEGKPARRPLARKNVNRHVVRIRTMFAWAVAEELIPGEALYRLKAVRALARNAAEVTDTDDVSPVPESDLAQTLKHLQPIPRAMAEVQLLTGMRPGELVRLRPIDLHRGAEADLGKGMRLQLAGCWIWMPAEHKTAHLGGKKVILFGPRAQAILQPFLDGRDPDAYLFSPAEARAAWEAQKRAGRKSRVQPSQQDRRKPYPRKRPGNAYSVDSYRRRITTACVQAGVNHWHPHQLRHNAATRLVAQFGWDVARIVLGHKHLDTTRIYATDALDKAIAAMREAG